MFLIVPQSITSHQRNCEMYCKDTIFWGHTQAKTHKYKTIFLFKKGKEYCYNRWMHDNHKYMANTVVEEYFDHTFR